MSGQGPRIAFPMCACPARPPSGHPCYDLTTHIAFNLDVGSCNQKILDHDVPTLVAGPDEGRPAILQYIAQATPHQQPSVYGTGSLSAEWMPGTY